MTKVFSYMFFCCGVFQSSLLWATCPNPDSLNHYVHSDFDPFNESTLKGQFKIYYRTFKSFDPGKKTLLVVPGGPGDDQRFYDPLFDLVTDKMNIVIFDHRGLGCSQPAFSWPGTFVPHAYQIKRAASDLESIRQDLLGKNGTWFVYGVSYGSVLAQAYAIQYPSSVDGLILDSAFYSTKGVTVGRETFVDKFVKADAGLKSKIDAFLTLHPDEKENLYRKIHKLAYIYEGRLSETPQLLNDLLSDAKKIPALLHEPDRPDVGMHLQIVCEEIWDYPKQLTNYYWPSSEYQCPIFRPYYIPINFEPDLKQLKVRTFIWGGRWDPATPIEAMREMNLLIKGSLFYENTYAAHGIIRDKNVCASNLLDLFVGNESDHLIQLAINSWECQSAPEPKTLKFLSKRILSKF